MSKKILAAFLAVCMIVGMMAMPVSAATAFPDVAEDHWAASAIERWAGYGVFNGDSDGNFTPEKQMTRAEFAQMLVNLLGLTKESEGTFADVPEDAWYAKVISIALAAGIMTGDNGNARPNDFVSFNEAVVMMARAFGLKPAADAEDQFPDSASWAKDALNAMAAMGAISASEDDQINPAMSFDRAAVAAVADKVIAEYVNEDREEPISGEINGVILVVNNAKVEIKDATVTAPIVVESASVTLTGTTAADVIVGGKEASVTADEESSVANVTVGGEAPVVDVKGEIASVTIAEGATEAKIDAPNVPEDAIVNNSTEEATVNGEAVEGKPEETTEPDEGDENFEGSVSGGGDRPAPETAVHVHSYTAAITKAATCKEDGVKTYTCSGAADVCDRKTYTESISKATASHSYTDGVCTVCGEEQVADCTHPTTEDVVETAATCAVKGTLKKYCTVCHEVKSTEEIPATGHSYSDGWVNLGTQHAHQCTVCGATDGAALHTVKSWKNAGENHTGYCTTCGATASEGHDYDEDTGKCACGAVESVHTCEAWATEWSYDSATKKHYHACTDTSCQIKTKDATSCSVASGAANGGWTPASGGGYAKVCQVCSNAFETSATCPLTGAGHGTNAGTCALCDAHVHNWGTATVKTAGNCVDAAQMEHECTLCHTKEDTTGGTVDSNTHKGTEYEDGTPGCTECNPDKNSSI